MNHRRLRRLSAVILVLAPITLSSPARAQQVVNVPNNTPDDTVALTTAIQSIGNGPAILQFSGGTYDLYATPGTVPFPGFSIANKTGITIRGTPLTVKGTGQQIPGTVLLLHNFDPNANPNTQDANAYPRILFNCNNVNGLTVEWLDIRMDREPYSTGRVSAKGTTGTLPWIELDMSRVYLDLTNGLEIQEILDYDPVTPRLKGLEFAVDAIEPSQFTATVSMVGTMQKVKVQATSATGNLSFNLSQVPLNTDLVLLHSKYNCHFIEMHGGLDASGQPRARDLVIRNSNIRDLPGLGVFALNVRNITIDNLAILPKADRLFSSTAGGALLEDTTGTLVMRNCHMKRIGDDALDSFSRYVRVASVTADPTNTDVTLSIPSNYYEIHWTSGQLVEFFSPLLVRRGSAPVAMTSFTLGPAGTAVARFPTAAMPPVFADDVCWNQSVSPDSLTMQDCIVEDNFAHGLRVHSGNVQITNCTFRRTSAPAILMEADLKNFQEAGPCDTVSVTGCTIDECNSFAATPGAITIFAQFNPPPTGCGSDFCLCDAGVHSNITIADNVFMNLRNQSQRAWRPSGFPRAAIWVTSSDDRVFINSNDFQNILYDPNKTDENILRGENNTLLRSDGGNCNNGFAGTPFVLLSSPLLQLHPLTCDW
jgi:hypothetical protein